MRSHLPIKKVLENPRAWVLVASVAVGLLAAWLAQSFLSRKVSELESRAQVPMTKVVVAKVDLRPGSTLNADTLAIRAVPSEWSHSNTVLPDQFALVESRISNVAIRAGEPLLWAMLEGEKVATFSRKVASGRRAITVPVDQINSISGMLEPADRIDLLITLESRGKTRLLPLLTNVEVLAAGQRLSSSGVNGQPSRYSTVTLDVSPAQAQRLVLGRELGRLTALLRHPDDEANLSLDTDGLESLLGGSGAPQGPFSPAVGLHVPVIYGGKKMNSDALQLLPGSLAADLPRTKE